MGNTFYPLTHAQRRIWYTEKFYPGTSVSNLSGFGKLKSASGIDSGLLTEAIRKFVRTNDTMRFRLMFEGERKTNLSKLNILMLQKAEEQTAFLNGDKLRRAGPCLCMTVRCLNLPLFALVKKKAGFLQKFIISFPTAFL